ncbi:ATP-binding protein [Parashewanella tropica]|uniref:ATP-binding protein n=1 Tax=Parashewanella tropica TaxID=2547970 RepID=UPI00105931A7|nr:ATP-binding protein [Parashewanella tropica]
MQLKTRNSPSLLTQLLVGAFIIISLLSISLAWLINQLHVQQSFNQQTEALMADIPTAIEAVKKHIDNPSQGVLDTPENPIDFLMVSCDKNHKQIWSSHLANRRNLVNTCNEYRKVKHKQPPYYVKLTDGKTYLIYPLELETQKQHVTLLVLKDAGGFSLEYQQFSQQTYIQLGVILLLTSLFLAAMAYWGIRPFRRMINELNQIKKGNTTHLNQHYPREFKGTVNALNQLLLQSAAQQERYKNTINDLAHSLKTRLSSIRALIEDTDNENKQNNILEQVYQMDDMVKYHLKRALLGRKSLIDESTKISEVIDQLVPILHKLYQERDISFTSYIDKKVTFPCNKDDLTELCGNLLENAFRLCISKVHFEAKRNKKSFYFSVEDDGPGIPDELKTKILQRGFRADTQHAGTGLGLAICKEIVDTYGGELNITTSKFDGAKIEIKIPVT